jgi:hypothetical protein
VSVGAWVVVAIAVTVPSGGLFAVAWQGGRRDGQWAAILDELRRIGNDHETRIRAIESWRGGARR